MKDKDKEIEIDIIGKAADAEDATALKAEIERLKQENASLTATLKTAQSDRKLYEEWWHKANKEKESLKLIVKSFVGYTGLA